MYSGCHVEYGRQASAIPCPLRRQPEDVTLVLFGGAGALHGPLLAREVGIRSVLVPSTPSVFCAYGGLVSELVHDTVAVVQGRQLDGKDLATEYAALVEQGRIWLDAQIQPSC